MNSGDIPALECALRCAAQSPPDCVRGRHLERRGPGGNKDARETIGFSKTPDSLFGDVPDLDSRRAAEIAKDREKRKSLRPSKRC